MLSIFSLNIYRLTFTLRQYRFNYNFAVIVYHVWCFEVKPAFFFSLRLNRFQASEHTTLIQKFKLLIF